MFPSLGKYFGVIAGSAGASGTLDTSTLTAGTQLWLQPDVACRIVPGPVASNTPGATYGVLFDAGDLFPHDIRTTSISAIAADGESDVNVYVFIRQG